MTDLTFRPLQPEQDAPLIHGWVTHPRGRFWGMGDKSVEEIRDVYAFVDSLEAHWAWIGEVEGRPVALLQTYEPEHDPIAEAYDVQPGDLGAHVFVAPGEDPSRWAPGSSRGPSPTRPCSGWSASPTLPTGRSSSGCGRPDSSSASRSASGTRTPGWST